MAFLSLPNEIFLDIVECLDNPKEIISALLVNRRLYYLLRDCPLQYNIRFQNSSALIRAARKGRLEIVRNILRLRPNVDTTAGFRCAETALHIAAKNGFFAMAKLLLEAGADPTVIDFQGQVPLVTAIVSGHEEIAGMIFYKTNKQATVIVDSSLNETPLHLACRYKRSKAIRYFLEAGADSNAKDSTGSTPLQCVLESNSIGCSYSPCDDTLQIILALLEFGTNLDPETLQILRHLYSQRPDSQTSIVRVGRIWIGPNFESGGKVSRPRIDEICLHLNKSEKKLRQDSGNTNSLHQASDEQLQESSATSSEHWFPDSQSFPSLNGNASPTMSNNPDSIWSPPKVKRLVATTPSPAKPKSLSAPSIQTVDPFPSLCKHESKSSVDIVSRDKWSKFRTPTGSPLAEGMRANPVVGEQKLDLGPRHTKARGRKGWQPLQV